MKKYYYLMIASSMFLFNSCRHESDLSGIREMSFASDIQAIIAGNCTQSKCHNSEGDARFPLITYDDVFSHGQIKTGDAHGSKLYQVISNHTTGNRMPPSYFLSDDQIKLIYIWIEQGAKNN